MGKRINKFNKKAEVLEREREHKDKIKKKKNKKHKETVQKQSCYFTSPPNIIIKYEENMVEGLSEYLT